ncbi:signal transducer and activator of transcription 1-like isoform X2 [Scyliorhinus canicula]|uniref:signal transducer and activator of transcription 1-like isoform X2 n=1 Tax=Scyliorhinus canicula TaxID=7830 RepID=UPI0018F380F5|nr:signal transducer and activator of transcription 1-like isoform X2 [Scyliorhinus canicula]
MSQWETLKQLDTKYLAQVDSLYQNENFPMDVREYLSHWIETQDWEKAITNYSLATIHYQNLLDQINNQYSRFMQEKQFVCQHNFKKYRQNMQECYGEDPVLLATVVAARLNQERKILNAVVEDQQTVLDTSQPVDFERHQDMEQKINGLKSGVQACEQELKFLEEQQDEFDFKYKTCKFQESHSSPKQVEEEMKVLQNMLNILDSNRKKVIEKFSELLKEAVKLLDTLVKEDLAEWKRRQQKACIGAPLDVSLDLLEKWFTATALCLFQVKRLLKKLEELGIKLTYDKDPFKTQRPDLEKQAIGLLTSLIQSAFVVETQPCMPIQGKMPLVLKTSSQFSVKPRLLVKLQEVGTHLMKVNACIDKNSPNGKGYRKFNILGTITKAMNTMESKSGGLCADFRHLQLKEQKSGIGGKGSNEASLVVTEELHVISFETELVYQELNVVLETCSLPIVVISNASQLLSGWASVVWYNMLCSDSKNLMFFSNPPLAPWSQLSEALSWQFSSNTKRHLDADQLSMLAEKLFGVQQKYADCCITWAMFSKENLPNQNFSFWLWLQGILELIKRYLEDIWNDGNIIGFLSRKRERSLLKRKPTGTFLLRFSESCKDGGITFSWVEHLPNGESKIRTVQPYTKTHLTNIPLSEILRFYKVIADENVPEHPLLYLYPNIPKDEAFGKYYLESHEGFQNHKYLKTRLIVVSERLSTPPDEIMDECNLEDIELSEPMKWDNIPMNTLQELMELFSTDSNIE